MTVYLGEETAIKIAKANEKGMPSDNSHYGLDRKRDEHNNKRGVAIGQCAKLNLDLGNLSERGLTQYIIDMIRKDIKNGDVIWYLYDQRILDPKSPPFGPSPTPPILYGPVNGINPVTK